MFHPLQVKRMMKTIKDHVTLNDPLHILSDYDDAKLNDFGLTKLDLEPLQGMGKIFHSKGRYQKIVSQFMTWIQSSEKWTSGK
jgi:hypothetical protein